MKNIIAILLITVGILMLAGAGLHLTTPDRPIEFQRMPPAGNHHLVLLSGGAFALTAGICLLIIRPNRDLRLHTQRR